jgi:hypothetical protein
LFFERQNNSNPAKFEIEDSRQLLVLSVILSDPDQDLLDKLDRRQHRSEVHWSGENALNVAGLVGILAACLACLRAR